MRNRRIVKVAAKGWGEYEGQYGLKQDCFNCNVPCEAPRLGDECARRAHTSPGLESGVLKPPENT